MGSQKANPKLYPTALTIVGSGWVDKWKWPKNAIMNVNNLLMERTNRERKNKERKQRKGKVSHHSTCLQEDSHDVSCDLIPRFESLNALKSLTPSLVFSCTIKGKGKNTVLLNAPPIPAGMDKFRFESTGIHRNGTGIHRNNWIPAGMQLDSTGIGWIT